MPTLNTIPNLQPGNATAEHPINHGFTTGGDITIRSSDGVDFSVHSIVLSLASPAFSDLLPPDSRPEVIRLGETSDLVALILGYIYPRPPPPITSFEMLDKALRVAEKYQLEGMKTNLRERLSLVDSAVSVYANPLYAFSLATTHGFQKEAELAAQVASKRFRFHNEEDLVKLIDAAPPVATLVKLIGLPLVQTRILVDVLFSFNKAPMQITGDNWNRIVCSNCRPIFQSVNRHSPPEWQARWAYWVFTEIKDRRIGECEEYFQVSFFNAAWFRSGSVSIPSNSSGTACSCQQFITSNLNHFNQWASGVYEHLKKKTSSLDKYRLSQTL